MKIKCAAHSKWKPQNYHQEHRRLRAAGTGRTRATHQGTVQGSARSPSLMVLAYCTQCGAPRP
jgi:hypothetical protein